MTQLGIWKYIKADPFFADLLPHIKNYKHKIRGFGGKGDPLDFSKDEIKQIRSALKKLRYTPKKQLRQKPIKK